MKKKAQFLISLSICLAGVLSVPCSLLYLGFGVPNQFENTFLGEFKHKVDRLDNVEGKKIVFIGGSSVPFAIRSELIEMNIDGYEIVDFGMYAGLGTKVMMDVAFKSINENDIVILMPEQQEQTLSMYFNPELMWQAIDGRFSLINRLTEEERIDMVHTYPSFASSKSRYHFSGKTPNPTDIYKKSSFDEYGDIDSDIPIYNVMPAKFDSNQPILFNEDVIQDDFIDYMNEYSKKIENKGAKVYYHYSPMNKLAINESYRDYHKMLKEKLEFDILGFPDSSILDYEYFYDTNFHLNNAGAINYTRNMIRDLKWLLNDTSEINFPYIKKPVSPEEEAKDGVNVDADYFEYSLDDDYCKITGLKDIKEKLIVPYRIENKKVVSFEKETFQNQSGIKTIVIQDNISSLSNGSFSGCTKLERIEIENTLPSSIRVGKKLLEGTDADIYVPEESLSLYLTNYFWSDYARRIHAIEAK